MSFSEKHLWGFLGFVTGAAFAGIFLEYKKIHFEPQITLGEISTLLMTVALAFFVPFIIEKILTSQIKVQDLIADELKKIPPIIDDCTLLVEEVIQNNITLTDFQKEMMRRLELSDNQWNLVISLTKGTNIHFEDGSYQEYCYWVTDVIFRRGFPYQDFRGEHARHINKIKKEVYSNIVTTMKA